MKLRKIRKISLFFSSDREIVLLHDKEKDYHRSIVSKDDEHVKYPSKTH